MIDAYRRAYQRQPRDHPQNQERRLINAYRKALITGRTWDAKELIADLRQGERTDTITTCHRILIFGPSIFNWGRDQLKGAIQPDIPEISLDKQLKALHEEYSPRTTRRLAILEKEVKRMRTKRTRNYKKGYDPKEKKKNLNHAKDPDRHYGPDNFQKEKNASSPAPHTQINKVEIPDTQEQASALKTMYQAIAILDSPTTTSSESEIKKDQPSMEITTINASQDQLQDAS